MNSSEPKSLSIILPAKNEERSLGILLCELRERHPKAEIIVVNDGSTDGTGEIAATAGAKVVTHPYSMGNGAAVKGGARKASGDILIFMDADGQHNPEDIAKLLRKLGQGYDMVVGARSRDGQSSVGRSLANRFYNWLATLMTGHRILDLTSGFRAVRADKFRDFLHLLPNGFSYPTTITMAFFRSAYTATYVPIAVRQRIGTNSHIHPVRDGVRFFLIIFKIATLYSPLKLFVPISAFFFLIGVSYYGYTFMTIGRFTNMTMLLFSASVIIFLIGLISEQITSLTYTRTRVSKADTNHIDSF